MKIVILGLSLSSSWGNGHATTWRALTKGLAVAGDEILFLERRAPWYEDHRDLADPDWCKLVFYESVAELEGVHRLRLEEADAVIVGSYVPEGVAVIDVALAAAPGRVAFYDIDTPVTLAALGANAATYIEPRQIPAFSVYFSFTGGPTLGRLEGRFGARKAAALYCCVDETLYALQACAQARWDMGYLGTYGADRQAQLEELLLAPARAAPHMRFVVAGPQYPADIDWPANVERIDHLAPGDHARFYAAQRFTLNVTRADMARAGYSPSVRLFEAGCCGAPVITDAWAGLADAFEPGEEILVARNRNDVLAILSDMDEETREGVGARARQRVLASHTGARRAQEMRACIKAASRISGDHSFAGA